MSRFWIFLYLLFSVTSFAGQKALVIVDMQDFFSNPYNKELSTFNQMKLNSLLEHQRFMIDQAKRFQVPILIVEYGISAAIGFTNLSILKQIGYHTPVISITKTTDGLFDPYNLSSNTAKDILKEWGATELIIMGANGMACIKETIHGGLKAGFKIWAYTNGIADFNQEDFEYPFSYQSTLPQEYNTWRAMGFEETLAFPN